jgi:hypothetical protein
LKHVPKSFPNSFLRYTTSAAGFTALVVSVWRKLEAEHQTCGGLRSVGRNV